MPIELQRNTTHYLDVTVDGVKYARALWYRPPTTTEALAYNRGLYNFEALDGMTGAPTVNQAAMIEAALPIIVGWEDGLFVLDGQSVSADPASPNYREDWPALLRDMAPQLLIQVASRAYGSVLVEKSHPFPRN